MIDGVEVTVDREAVVVTAAEPLAVVSSAVVGGGLTSARAVVNLHVPKSLRLEETEARLAAFAERRRVPGPWVGLLTSAWTEKACVAQAEADGLRALADFVTMTPRAPLGRRRLVTIGTSLALHGGLLLAVLLAVSGETELGALFIDLTESARSEAAGGAAGPPAAAPIGRGGRRASRPIMAARLAPAPSTSLGIAEPSPPDEPAPARDP